MITRPAATAFGRLAGLAAAAALAAVILAAQAAPGQAPQAEQPQKPTFRVATNFVQVDVYPTANDRAVTDLAAADFEVLEDGTPQKIETFEHITTRTPTSQEMRAEPSTVEASRQMAADLARRLFVLFLDTYHVEGAAALQVRQPLVDLLTRVVGQNDVVAVMTPEMSAGELTFTTRTQSIEALLARNWDWARRGQITSRDPQESMWEVCYPADPLGSWQDTIVGRMIERRREKLTLDALHDLVVTLEGLREGRKAVITVSDGWRLFREDRTLVAGAKPELPGVFVGPGGKLGVGADPRTSPGGASMAECERDRVALSMIDDEQAFRTLLDDANRANVSFYTVDPRGLPAWDTPIGPSAPIGVVRDQAQLRTRLESLRTMAGATDGLAILDSNDFNPGLRRVADDLSSYYLLGYYSTNSKPDGRFHRITVRVKRPGVAVRARRGYRAPSEADLTARNATGGAAGPAPAVDEAALAARDALVSLVVIRTDVPVRFQAGYAWQPAEPAPEPSSGVAAGARLWVAGELDATRAAAEGWVEGAECLIALSGEGRKEIASTRVTVSRTARAFRVLLPERTTLAPGAYDVRIAPKPVQGRAVPMELLRVIVPAAPSGTDLLVLGQPSLWRRGPFTGPTFQPAGDPRYRRQEWIRVEVAKVGAAEEVSAALLGRTGQPLDVPVRTSERQDGAVSWISAEVALAPLAQGDYLVRIEARGKGKTERVLAAFRIIP